jgi:hypothetical protein
MGHFGICWVVRLDRPRKCRDVGQVVEWARLDWTKRCEDPVQYLRGCEEVKYYSEPKFRELAQQYLDSAGFALRHAYTSRDTALLSGSDHIVVASGALHGRLKRGPGDALCKPARKFTYLARGDDYEDQHTNLCASCTARAKRLGVELEYLSHDTPIIKK